MYAVLRMIPLICSISLDRPKHALGNVKTLAISHRPSGNAVMSYIICMLASKDILQDTNLYLLQSFVAVVDTL